MISSNSISVLVLLISAWFAQTVSATGCCQLPDTSAPERATDALECKVVGWNTSEMWIDYKCDDSKLDRGTIRYYTLANTFRVDVDNKSSLTHSLSFFAECQDMQGKAHSKTNGIRCDGIASNTRFVTGHSMPGLDKACDAFSPLAGEQLRIFSFTPYRGTNKQCWRKPIFTRG